MSFKLFRKFRRKIKVRKNHSSKYYHQQNLIKDKADLIVTLNPLPSTEVYNSDKSFMFNNILLNNLDLKTMKDKLGSPAYVLWNDEMIPKHKIFYYRDHIGNYKFLMQVHFINKNFVFASNRISSRDRLTERDKQEIVRQLLLKYTDRDADEPRDDFELKLIDKDGNTIFTNDTVYFYVNYLPNNDYTRQLIEELNIDTSDRDKERLREDIQSII